MPRRAVACRSYPGYFLVAARPEKRWVYPRPSDRCRRPFRVEYEVYRRKHDGHLSKNPVMPRPVLNKGRGKNANLRRWELKLELRYAGKRVTTSYHRVVGFTMVPCMQDEQGAYVEPYFPDPKWEGWYEVHHLNENTRDNRCVNLQPMWWWVHRTHW